MECKTKFSPFLGCFLFGKQKDSLFFWEGSSLWMLHIGRARHSGPGKLGLLPLVNCPLSLTIVGGWLTYW